MAASGNRIYKYDNVKALLILLVVIGHMTTDYVSDSHMVRWITLWIYTFHMPAFVFLSGLVHKQYITQEQAAAGIRGETRMRWDKAAGYFLCAYSLKIFLQFTRTLMGQHPLWHWIEEPGIPWYLFVMAEYEMLFYVIRRIDRRAKPWMVITGALILSAAVGYFPAVGDTFCISRMINFLPIYALGYYLDMREFLGFVGEKKARIAGWAVIAASVIICRFGPWGMYSMRKWFTGRRSYDFLTEFFGGAAIRWGWLIRPAVWAVAMLITLAILSVIPDRDLGFITKAGSRTLQVYFWHRPLCYWFRTLKVLPRLFILFGGSYDESVAGQIPGHAFHGGVMSMLPALTIYILIGVLMTAFFSLGIFRHPTDDLMKLGRKIGGGSRK